MKDFAKKLVKQPSCIVKSAKAPLLSVERAPQEVAWEKHIRIFYAECSKRRWTWLKRNPVKLKGQVFLSAVLCFCRSRWFRRLPNKSCGSSANLMGIVPGCTGEDPQLTTSSTSTAVGRCEVVPSVSPGTVRSVVSKPTWARTLLSPPR